MAKNPLFSESEKNRMTRAAGIVSFATLLSRILGFFRDVVIAWFFGAGMVSDAFFVAFRIPNLLRRLFAEGSLTVTFIPIFTDILEKNGKAPALRFAASAIRLLSVVLVAAAVAGVVLAPLIVKIIAPGFAASTGKFALTVALTRLLIPYIIFIGLVALSMGILNVLGHFAAPALAPVFLNLAMILSVMAFAPLMEQPVFGLAAGVLIGGAIQLGIQLPFLFKHGIRTFRKAPFFHPAFRKIGKLMIPAVLGAAAYQINLVVGTLLASLLPDGSISYLYYADRLIQFPHGIFAVAMATAALPSLSRLVAAEDMTALRDTFENALKLVMFIIIPSMVGLVVLRGNIVEVLFQRGAFDARTATLTASAVLYYALGLWAFSAVRIVVSTFYALQDTGTPFWASGVAILSNLAMGLLLMGPMGHRGLALATTLAAIVNLGILVRVLNRRIHGIAWREIICSTGLTLVSAAAMGLVVWGVSMGMPSTLNTSWVGLVISICIGVGCYGGISWFLKRPENVLLLSGWRSRLARDK